MPGSALLAGGRVVFLWSDHPDASRYPHFGLCYDRLAVAYRPRHWVVVGVGQLLLRGAAPLLVVALAGNPWPVGLLPWGLLSVLLLALGLHGATTGKQQGGALNPVTPLAQA